MAIYECMYCEYKFDTDKGDERYDIPAGIKIEEMGEDWECPECAQLGKDAFILKEE
ncbi:MAG: rubredoxin [archaeon]|nr:rubredoxin [archaeon]